eukprot:726486-Hanusia_phi.AAC.1
MCELWRRRRRRRRRSGRAGANWSAGKAGRGEGRGTARVVETADTGAAIVPREHDAGADSVHGGPSACLQVDEDAAAGVCMHASRAGKPARPVLPPPLPRRRGVYEIHPGCTHSWDFPRGDSGGGSYQGGSTVAVT